MRIYNTGSNNVVDLDLLNLYSKPFLYPEPKFNIDKKLKKLQLKKKI